MKCETKSSLCFVYFQEINNGMIGVKATTECTGTSSQHQHQRTGVFSSNYPSQNHHHMQPTSRERTMHAVEYYNSNVLKARMGAGLAGPRSSVNERHLSYGGRPLNSIGTRLYQAPTDNIYRSNSSLELLDPSNDASPGGPLRREYGSHGSIDVISSDRSPVAQSTSESFFAMLQEYRPAVLGMNNNNNNNKKESTSSQEPPQNYRNSSLITEDNVDRGNSSPKLRMKLKLWGQTTKTQRSQSHVPTVEDGNTSNATTTATTTVASADIEERTKRRAFAHYDCQSLTANLGYAAKLRGLLLARRRSTLR